MSKAHISFKTNGVDDLSELTISNPPTQAEVTAMRDKMNEVIGVLKN